MSSGGWGGAFVPVMYYCMIIFVVVVAVVLVVVVLAIAIANVSTNQSTYLSVSITF